MSTSKATSTAAPQTDVKPVAPTDLPSTPSGKPAVASTASPAVNAGTKRAPKTATKTATKAPQKVKVSTSTVKPSSSTKAVNRTHTSAKSAPKTAPKASPKPATQPNTKVTTRQTVAPEKVKAVKEKKVKVVRDSFTIPKTEFEQLSAMKKRATALGVDIKKSEVIRAGLQLLSGLADAAFTKALTNVPTIKPGRPSKD